MDLIDRQALLKQIDIDSDGEPGYYGDTWKFIDTIKSMPSATDKNVGTKLGTDLAEVGTDCISRQSAIDAIDEYMVGKNCAADGTMMARLINELVIKQLPSAQREIKQQAINSSDCIDRRAALDALRKMQTYKLFSGDDMLLIDQAGAQTELMLLPSAQPEIVRCKDCDWWTKQEDSPQGRCALLQMYPTGGWFCGNARRGEVTT